MKKKVLITTSTLIVALLLVLIVLGIVFFMPRDLKRLVKEDGAVSVAIVSYFNEEELYRLNDDEEKEFWAQVKKAKYKPQTDFIKGVSEFLIEIEYQDGKKVTFDEYKAKQYASNGEVLKTTPMILTFYAFEHYQGLFQ